APELRPRAYPGVAAVTEEPVEFVLALVRHRHGARPGSSRVRACVRQSRPRPRVEDAALGLALVGIGELEVVLEGRGFEGAVRRVREHDPLAAPAVLVVLEHLETLGLRAAVLVDEVAAVVPEVEEHAIALRHASPLLPRPCGSRCRTPSRPCARRTSRPPPRPGWPATRPC